MNEMGKGVFVEVTDEGKILIEVDGTKDFGPSSSGKSIIIASTSGNKKVMVNDEEVFIGLNIYRK